MRSRACISRSICYYAIVIGVPGAGIEGTTDMTVTSIAAETPSTCCAICARPARRGDRLCAQCKTAVKRARQVPSLPAGLLPRVGGSAVANGLPGAGEGRAVQARRAVRSALPAVPGGWGTYATLVAFGAAVSITGYFATDKQEEASNRERGAQAMRTASVAELHGERGPRAQPPMPSSAAAEGPSWDEAIAQIEWTLPQTPPAHSQGAPPGRKSPRDARSAGDEARRPIEARSADTEPQPAPIATGETVAVARAAPAPETQPAPATDRRQLMAAALSRCERENLLAGFVCKERAWLQFCDGQWGEVPQCPGGVLSNNAR